VNLHRNLALVFILLPRLYERFRVFSYTMLLKFAADTELCRASYLLHIFTYKFFGFELTVAVQEQNLDL